MLSEDMQTPSGQHVSKESKEDYTSAANTLSPSGTLWWSQGACLNSEHPNRGMRHDNSWTNTGSAPISNLYLPAVSLSEDFVLFFRLQFPQEQKSSIKGKTIFFFLIAYFSYNSLCIYKSISSIWKIVCLTSLVNHFMLVTAHERKQYKRASSGHQKWLFATSTSKYYSGF